MLVSDTAITKLNVAQLEIPELRLSNPDSNEFRIWERMTALLISNIYGKDSKEYSKFQLLPFHEPNIAKAVLGGVERSRPYLESMDEADGMLLSYIKEIEDYGMPETSPNESMTHRQNGETEVVGKLRRLVKIASDLGEAEPYGPEFKRWSHNVETALIRIFGNQSREHHSFIHIPKTHVMSGMPGAEARLPRQYKKCILDIGSLLSASIDQIEEYEINSDSDSQAEIQPAPVPEPPKSNKVFVIHGHDELMKETVARFLEKIGADPIILHEQPNEGLTIIEKFEKNSDVAFAIALLTPDDVGGVNEETLSPRARQNVVLELGYFMGSIGRKCTCAIVKGGIEKPSDYDGVVYISFKNGEWKMDLVKELQAGGLAIDANKAV